MHKGKARSQVDDSPPEGAVSHHAQELVFFRQNRSKLQRKYADWFVAILDNRVVDSDQDFRTLERRAGELSGGRAPLITYASAAPLDKLLQAFKITEPFDAAASRKASE